MKAIYSQKGVNVTKKNNKISQKNSDTSNFKEKILNLRYVISNETEFHADIGDSDCLKIVHLLSLVSEKFFLSNGLLEDVSSLIEGHVSEFNNGGKKMCCHASLRQQSDGFSIMITAIVDPYNRDEYNFIGLLSKLTLSIEADISLINRRKY